MMLYLYGHPEHAFILAQDRCQSCAQKLTKVLRMCESLGNERSTTSRTGLGRYYWKGQILKGADAQSKTVYSTDIIFSLSVIIAKPPQRSVCSREWSFVL